MFKVNDNFLDTRNKSVWKCIKKDEKKDSVFFTIQEYSDFNTAPIKKYEFSIIHVNEWIDSGELVLKTRGE